MTMKVQPGPLFAAHSDAASDLIALSVSAKHAALPPLALGAVADAVKGDVLHGAANRIDLSWITELPPLSAISISDVAKAIGGTVQTYGGPPILGAFQAARADQKFNELSFLGKIQFNTLLAQARSPQERDYLRKALAAGHDIGEITQFAAEIRGKSPEWMQHNLRLVDDSYDGGKGIEQQWNDSCVPATAEALRGEFDPIYSLREHQGNRDVDQTDSHVHVWPFNILDVGGNGNVADEQRADLQAHGGIAVDRGDTGGRGMNEGVGINELSSITGVTYAKHDATNSFTRGLALQKMDEDLARGIPCALHINGGKGEGGHACLVTGVISGPPKEYAIHDPFAGKTVYVKASDLQAGNIVPAIAGWTKLADVYTASRGFLGDLI
jgi:hypothetical protein